MPTVIKPWPLSALEARVVSLLMESLGGNVPMNFHKRACSVLMLLTAFAVTGCGNRPSKVTGTVTLDGTPVEGAHVTFSPVDGKGRSASGGTSSGGKFELTTFKENDGALPGEYKVTVTYRDPIEFDKPPATGIDAMKSGQKAQPKAKKAKYDIPPSYGDEKSTPLPTVKVPTSGPVALEIKSKG
jgi:hypothetical protein